MDYLKILSLVLPSQLLAATSECGYLKGLQLTPSFITSCCFSDVAKGSPNLLSVLLTALDIASAMVHMHCENIIHGDLKARNILLKTSATDARGFTAKVADFGLSMQVDPNDTHVSEVSGVMGGLQEL